MKEKIDNIIGDYMEIYSDIVSSCFNSKLPGFINSLKERYYLKKLITRADKLRRSNVPLNSSNIRELFVYMYNSYVPLGQYKSIKYVKCIDNDYVGSIATKNYIITIKTYIEEDNMNINLQIYREKLGGYSVYNFESDSISSTNPDISKQMVSINNDIYNLICDYIIDSLNMKVRAKYGRK